jgi:diacylglycerol kinase family enzyme
MLVAAGGDGSYHEVVNGMLARSDKKKLPIGMIPNGSGNDTCSSLGVMNLEDALNYIVNAEVLAIDTVRCLIDHDEYDQIADTDEAKLNYCRHMLINCTLAMPAKIANEAQKYKQCCGKNCYAVATLEQSILGRML